MNTDHSGAAASASLYYPWGQVWSATYLPFGDAQRIIVNNVDNLYRFADMEYDTESGLYQTLFRKYSPNLTRWLGADPVASKIDNL